MEGARGLKLALSAALLLSVGAAAAHPSERFPIFDGVDLQPPIVASAGGSAFLVLGQDGSRIAARRLDLGGGGAVTLLPPVHHGADFNGETWLALEPDSRHRTFLALWRINSPIGLRGVILDRWGRRLGEPFFVGTPSDSPEQADVAYDALRDRWIVAWTNNPFKFGRRTHHLRILHPDGSPAGPTRVGGEDFGYDPLTDTMLVAWTRSGRGLKVQFRNAAGQPLGHKRLISKETSPPFVHFSQAHRRWLTFWTYGHKLYLRFFADPATSDRVILKQRRGFAFLGSIAYLASQDRYLISWVAMTDTTRGGVWSQWLDPDGTSPRKRIRVSPRQRPLYAGYGQFTACASDRPVCLVTWNGSERRSGLPTDVFGRFLSAG